MVIPIGKAVLTKYIFTMPQSMEYQIQLEIVLSWKQNTYPTPIQIIGLDSALICE
jgi:hypothetical protein